METPNESSSSILPIMLGFISRHIHSIMSFLLGFIACLLFPVACNFPWVVVSHSNSLCPTYALYNTSTIAPHPHGALAGASALPIRAVSLDISEDSRNDHPNEQAILKRIEEVTRNAEEALARSEKATTSAQAATTQANQANTWIGNVLFAVEILVALVGIVVAVAVGLYFSSIRNIMEWLKKRFNDYKEREIVPALRTLTDERVSEIQREYDKQVGCFRTVTDQFLDRILKTHTFIYQFLKETAETLGEVKKDASGTVRGLSDEQLASLNSRYTILLNCMLLMTSDSFMTAIQALQAISKRDDMLPNFVEMKAYLTTAQESWFGDEDKHNAIQSIIEKVDRELERTRKEHV